MHDTQMNDAAMNITPAPPAVPGAFLLITYVLVPVTFCFAIGSLLYSYTTGAGSHKEREKCQD